jgi:hypothetical protein
MNGSEFRAIVREIILPVRESIHQKDALERHEFRELWYRHINEFSLHVARCHPTFRSEEDFIYAFYLHYLMEKRRGNIFHAIENNLEVPMRPELKLVK